MSEMPWVRFFPSDWLAGTRGMSAAEMGVYINLIAMMYERGEPIGEDHARLARLCGASNSSFKKVLETLVDEGKILRVEGGLWNGRVEKEVVYRSEKSEVGRQAAQQRWSKKTSKNNGRTDANALRSQCDGNANQSPDTREDTSPGFSEEKPSEAAAAAQPDPSVPQRELFQRGRQVLGNDAGGLINRLLKAKGNNVALARAAIEQASTKDSPREFIGATLARSHGPPGGNVRDLLFAAQMAEKRI